MDCWEGNVKAFCGAMLGLALLGTTAHSAPRNDEGQGWIHIPESSIESPFDIGVRAKTNHQIQFRPASGTGTGLGQTPSPTDLHNSYYPKGFVPVGSGTIAIIIAYHYPNAQ